MFFKTLIIALFVSLYAQGMIAKPRFFDFVVPEVNTHHTNDTTNDTNDICSLIH